MEQASVAAIVDAHGVVTGWSEGARRLTGHRAEETVGRPARELLAHEPPPGAVAALAGTAALRHRDGSTVLAALRACPVLDAEGRPDRYVVTAEPDGRPGPALDGRAFQQASMPMSVFDTRQRYLRLNDAACRRMGVPESALLGRPYLETVARAEADHSFAEHLRRVAETGEPTRYETFAGAPAPHREHAWSVEMWPVRDASGELTGVALAEQDSSEQYWSRRRLALLNEAAAGIGTTLDVVRTAEELVELLVPQFADFATVDLLEWVLGADEPPIRPVGEVVLRRVAHGSVTEGIPEAAVRLGDRDVRPPSSAAARAMRADGAVLSHAGEPEFTRWIADRDARRPAGSSYRSRAHSMITVPLRARGTTLGVMVAVRVTQPDAYAADDAVFAEELASRAAVCVDNARRFARERTIALALQRSLLPRRLGDQAAAEVAHRYVPCASPAGVGGDWFDVIPLSGSRVALVVGDVVGHGIQAQATMGRLRTAVRTLADVDLPPDELLTHLDDLVTHLAGDHGDDVPESGATCLYAVYDPVARRLALAAAGHPPPALVLPGRTAEPVALVPGPPLGVGGLPFEAAELELPEGSLLALFTDGLLQRRGERADAELRRALSGPAGSLDDLADDVLKGVLPKEPDDDVVLLLARTRALGADRVATWDVTPDPEHVAATRQAAAEQLALWGLREAAFVTELVVSELVTNAIRYGGPPVQLRLIRDRTLICEVSDSSSTSPHLRRAHVYDEGGRGLLLVAQLTQRWGSRPNGRGKTIWCEQPLPPA